MTKDEKAILQIAAIQYMQLIREADRLGYLEAKEVLQPKLTRIIAALNTNNIGIVDYVGVNDQIEILKNGQLTH